jgi:hypothetical protein
MIYYYRKGEAKLTPQTDEQIRTNRLMQTTLQLDSEE